MNNSNDKAEPSAHQLAEEAEHAGKLKLVIRETTLVERCYRLPDGRTIGVHRDHLGGLWDVTVKEKDSLTTYLV